MDNTEPGWSIKEKVEVFLSRACEAEAKKNFVEAERLFNFALFCDAKLRPDVVDARQYVNQTEPVYAVAQLMP